MNNNEILKIIRNNVLNKLALTDGESKTMIKTFMYISFCNATLPIKYHSSNTRSGFNFDENITIDDAVNLLSVLVKINKLAEAEYSQIDSKLNVYETNLIYLKLLGILKIMLRGIPISKKNCKKYFKYSDISFIFDMSNLFPLPDDAIKKIISLTEITETDYINCKDDNVKNAMKNDPTIKKSDSIKLLDDITETQTVIFKANVCAIEKYSTNVLLYKTNPNYVYIKNDIENFSLPRMKRLVELLNNYSDLDNGTPFDFTLYIRKNKQAGRIFVSLEGSRNSRYLTAMTLLRAAFSTSENDNPAIKYFRDNIDKKKIKDLLITTLLSNISTLFLVREKAARYNIWMDNNFKNLEELQLYAKDFLPDELSEDTIYMLKSLYENSPTRTSETENYIEILKLFYKMSLKTTRENYAEMCDDFIKDVKDLNLASAYFLLFLNI